MSPTDTFIKSIRIALLTSKHDDDRHDIIEQASIALNTTTANIIHHVITNRPDYASINNLVGDNAELTLTAYGYPITDIGLDTQVHWESPDYDLLNNELKRALLTGEERTVEHFENLLRLKMYKVSVELTEERYLNALIRRTSLVLPTLETKLFETRELNKDLIVDATIYALIAATKNMCYREFTPPIRNLILEYSLNTYVSYHIGKLIDSQISRI